MHPKSKVEYWLRGGLRDKDPATGLFWRHNGSTADIIAFRVTKVHREPKVIWVNEYASSKFVYQSEERAKRNSGASAIRTAVKYQEVIEND